MYSEHRRLANGAVYCHLVSDSPGTIQSDTAGGSILPLLSNLMPNGINKVARINWRGLVPSSPSSGYNLPTSGCDAFGAHCKYH